MIELDGRIAAGMREQLRLRRKALREGARPLGWKVGFGSATARAQLDIDRPLVGFLTDRGLLDDGAIVDIGDWTRPVFEPEIAVHLGRDPAPGASPEQLRQAVAGLSAAIELADVNPPPTEVEAILAGNIFHRHVVLGRLEPGRATAEGVRARVLRDGAVIGSTDDPAALTGGLLEVVRLTGELLEACGERLRGGEVVITGSVIAPVAVAPGERLAVELGPLGGLSVAFVRGGVADRVQTSASRSPSQSASSGR